MKSLTRMTCAAAATAAFVGCAGDVRPEQEPIGTARQAITTRFAAGSFIIPMGNNHQDAGMLRAYGLAYALLRANVPVHWAVAPGKAVGDNDFMVAAPAAVVNRETGAALAAPVQYRGGPFIVSDADRATALPIITAWLAADNVTVVHEVTAGSFAADVAKTLTAAPSVAVFEDGFEGIAYANLNAAGILDANSNAWSTASSGSLSQAQIRGSVPNNADGALFDARFPRFAFLSSEHYEIPDGEVVAEVRSWLDAGAYTHAFMQCAAITAFENTAPNGSNPGGRFLTTAGLSNAGTRPNPVTNRLPSDPIAQIDGSISSDTGTTSTLSLANSSAFRPNVRTVFNEADEPLDREIMLLTGVLDGNVRKGRVTYLTGHDYSTVAPVSSNPRTNGTRLFFNALFDSPAAVAAGQPAITVTKAAPAVTNASTITFTISYANGGAAPARNVVITDPLPVGTTFSSASSGGTLSGGSVRWNVGVVAPGATGSVSFTVTPSADGSFTNQAVLSYQAWQTSRTARSNTTSTVRDSVAPDTSIISSPPSTTTSPDATFDFASTEPGVTYECSLDGAAFAPCTDPATLTNLGKGQHTLAVRAKDAAGNTDPTPASRTWTIGDDDAGAGTDAGADAGTDSGTDAGFDAGTDAGADGGSTTEDTDGDGLSNAIELAIGTDPNDADTDDDGVSDGQEPSYDKDSDGDGLINALDPDSDNDGLFDGTEMGLGCALAATNRAANQCVPDADEGATKTSPVDRDSDDGGILDGDEDTNRNGRVDSGERNPNDAADDKGRCTTDAECGAGASGRVCRDGTCVDGCRGTGGNGCSVPDVCSSTTDAIGTCEPPIVAGPSTIDSNVLEGGGCDCAVGAGRGNASAGSPATLATLVAMAITGIRRKRRG